MEAQGWILQRKDDACMLDGRNSAQVAERVGGITFCVAPSEERCAMRERPLGVSHLGCGVQADYKRQTRGEDSDLEVLRRVAC